MEFDLGLVENHVQGGEGPWRRDTRDRGQTTWGDVEVIRKRIYLVTYRRKIRQSPILDIV